MTEEERKLLQELVDDSFTGFQGIVVSGRPKFKDDPAALDAAATGQIFTAKQALEHGLVDKIGFVEDAIARAAELASESDRQRALREIRGAADADRRARRRRIADRAARGSIDLSAADRSDDAASVLPVVVAAGGAVEYSTNQDYT